MAAELAIELGKTRWLMHAQNASAISTPLLVVVVFWLAILFVSFGVYAKPSATGYIALFVCAISVAAAVFLILEMDRPFDGIIQISDEPLRGVLNRLGKDEIRGARRDRPARRQIPLASHFGVPPPDLTAYTRWARCKRAPESKREHQSVASP